MKVVILAGGLGTRISEYSEQIPKPLIEVGGKPIIHRIMKQFARFDLTEFIVCLGYKGHLIKEYFVNQSQMRSDIEVDLASGNVAALSQESDCNWTVKLIDTGLESMTGGRLLRIKEQLSDETFLMTYGDGLANVNLNELIDFHNALGRVATVTAVHPAARFGELVIDNVGVVGQFKEKPQVNQGWINGGFFVFEPQVFDYLTDDLSILEREPLERLASDGQLAAYRHEGFWQCMDTKRDKLSLDELALQKPPPWEI